MYSLEVYIQNERLDLFKDETVSLNSSVQNIKDISKVFSDFTKSFTAPPSKKNNKIFKHWYNSDITGGFNASVRQEAELKLNGVRYKLGKIQLESVKLKDGIVENYKITFYGELINLTDLFADDLLSELDLSAYNHDYTSENVKLGLQSGILSGNIIYPLISSERNWDYNTNIVDNEIKYSTGVGIAYNELKPAIKINRIIEAIESRYGVTFTNNFFKNTTNSIDELFMWLNGTVAGSIGANSLGIDWDGGDSENVNHTTDIGVFRTYNTSASNDRIYWGHSIWIIPDAGYFNAGYTIRVYDEEEVIYESTVDGTGYASNFFGFEIRNRVNGEDIYNLRVEIESAEEFKYTSQWRQLKHWSSADETFLTLGSSQTISDDLQITNNLPNIKVVDFFKGLVKMFNLVIEPLSYTSFNIDTLDSWYLDGGNQNLTEYIDVESYDVNKPKLYKNINFKYEEAEAIVGYNFFDTNKVGYGDLEAEFNVDGGSLDIEIPFENMLMEKLTDTTTGAETNIQVGNAFDKDLKPVVLPPILFFNRGSVDTTQYFGLVNESNVSTKITSYLNVGAESSVIDGESDMSLNFGSEISSWNLTTQSASLFNTFWRDYITDLYDSKRREYVYKANLPLKILNKLKLNDLIEIRGKNYIINSLDINLTSGDVKLNLLNYIGGALTAKTIGTLLANLSGTSTMLARINQVSTLSMFAELVGTSELLATLDTAITPTLQEVTDVGNTTTNDLIVKSDSTVQTWATNLAQDTYFVGVNNGSYGGVVGGLSGNTLLHFAADGRTRIGRNGINGDIQYPNWAAARTITFQDKSGTVALLSDISAGTGTVTNVTVGTGLDVANGTTIPNITLDFNEFSAGGTLVATDYLIAQNGSVENRQLISSIPLSIFNNDLGGGGTGTVTSVSGLLPIVVSNGTTAPSISINYATVSAAGTVSTAAQSFAGVKTFTSNVIANDFIGSSDIRLKENIKTIELKEIDSVYKSFNFKDNKQKRVGVIAQELEITNPEFVRTDKEGMKAVSYTDLHSAEIAYLKQENKELKEKLDLIITKLGI